MDAAAIVRGYPYAPDQYVVIEPEELEKLRPARDKAAWCWRRIRRPRTQIEADLLRRARLLYLLPDGIRDGSTPSAS